MTPGPGHYNPEVVNKKKDPLVKFGSDTRKAINHEAAMTPGVG